MATRDVGGTAGTYTRRPFPSASMVMPTVSPSAGATAVRAGFLRSPAPCAGAHSRAAGEHSRRLNPGLAPAARVAPCPQPRSGNPQLPGNQAQRPAAACQKPQSLPFEFIRISTACHTIKQPPAPKGAYQRCPPFRRRFSLLRCGLGHQEIFWASALKSFHSYDRVIPN
jgi:hypothetical protein